MVRKIILSWIIWWTCNHNLGTCADDNTTIILINETLSWSDGQQACLDRNGTMLSEQEAKSKPEVIQQLTSSDEYWTGMHQYLSDWIGVFGWEYRNTITGLAGITTHELEWPSPGSCQEICHKYRTFSLTGGSTCICIPSSATYSREFSKVSQWTICNNSETPNTCGGNNNGQEIVSLYGDTIHLGSSISEDDGNCMSARCDVRSGNAVLQARNCELNLFRSCEPPDSDSTRQLPWKQAYEGCLDISSLYFTDMSCLFLTQIPRTIQRAYWVGYKRQFYTRQDKGYNVDVAAVQRCQSCSTNGTCQYQEKSQCGAEKWVMCRVPYSEEITSIALPPETTQPETSPETATVTEATKETIVNFRDTDDGFPWLIVIVSAGGGVVLLIVILSSVLCVRMRRKKKERTEFDSTRDGNKTTNNDYEHTNDKKLIINGEGQPKNEKDIYDHLARNEGFRPEEDTYDVTGSDGQNVYNHLQLRGHVQNESESNVYDVSSSSGVPKIESESNVYNVSSHQNEDIYNHLREELPGGNLDDVYDISSCNNDKNDDIYNHLQSNATTPCSPLDEYAMYDVTSAT